jgi:hypothetical protein
VAIRKQFCDLSDYLLWSSAAGPASAMKRSANSRSQYLGFRLYQKRIAARFTGLVGLAGLQFRVAVLSIPSGASAAATDFPSDLMGSC